MRIFPGAANPEGRQKVKTYGSFHARLVFRGWLKPEMHRLLTLSSKPDVSGWLEECAVFYSHLRNRGYPSKAIDSTFRTINWNQRSKMPKKHMADNRLFARYRGCVFSNRSAPGSAELRVEMGLSLEELRERGRGRDFFPPRAFFALRSALPMGYAPSLPR